MIIAVDFDGTIVEHDYPRIGAPNPGATTYMREWIKEGAKVILWTMRSGERLREAEDYCRSAGVDLFGINTNPDQSSWTESPKAYAHIYVDDAAFGTPMFHPMGWKRPAVDWSLVGPAVLEIVRSRQP